MRSYYLTVLLATVSAFFSSTEIYGAPNQLLQCLAKEESQLHKEKAQGVLYRLNQDFINELASSNDINLKNVYISEICHSKTTSPTIALLHLLLIKESEIYDLTLSEVDPAMRAFKMNYINEFQKQVPHFFIQFLSGLQAEMATPDCLAKAIPELNYFNERLKYLEEEMSTHEVMKDKTKIDIIFSKLKDLSSIKANCSLQASRELRKLKSKMKKKEDSKL